MTAARPQRPRITIGMLLLAFGPKLPKPARVLAYRAYGACSGAKLWVLAARPARYRLMVSEGYGRPVEWCRYTGRYRMPISTAAEAVRRLVYAEQSHPGTCWWIEPGPAPRWHRPARFDDDYRELLS